MPPEIVMQLPHDKEVDIWSLGILLYELLHGIITPLSIGFAPYKGESIEEIENQISKKKLMFGQHISIEAKDILIKLLKPDPKERITLEAIFYHPYVQKHIHDYEDGKPAYTFFSIPKKPEQDDIDAESRIEETLKNKKSIQNEQQMVQEMMIQENILQEDIEKVLMVDDGKGGLKMKFILTQAAMEKRLAAKSKSNSPSPFKKKNTPIPIEIPRPLTISHKSSSSKEQRSDGYEPDSNIIRELEEHLNQIVRMQAPPESPVMKAQISDSTSSKKHQMQEPSPENHEFDEISPEKFSDSTLFKINDDTSLPKENKWAKKKEANSDLTNRYVYEPKKGPSITRNPVLKTDQLTQKDGIIAKVRLQQAEPTEKGIPINDVNENVSEMMPDIVNVDPKTEPLKLNIQNVEPDNSVSQRKKYMPFSPIKHFDSGSKDGMGTSNINKLDAGSLRNSLNISERDDVEKKQELQSTPLKEYKLLKDASYIKSSNEPIRISGSTSKWTEKIQNNKELWATSTVIGSSNLYNNDILRNAESSENPLLRPLDMKSNKREIRVPYTVNTNTVDNMSSSMIGKSTHEVDNKSEKQMKPTVLKLKLGKSSLSAQRKKIDKPDAGLKLSAIQESECSPEDPKLSMKGPNTARSKTPNTDFRRDRRVTVNQARHFTGRSVSQVSTIRHDSANIYYGRDISVRERIGLYSGTPFEDRKQSGPAIYLDEIDSRNNLNSNLIQPRFRNVIRDKSKNRIQESESNNRVRRDKRDKFNKRALEILTSNSKPKENTVLTPKEIPSKIKISSNYAGSFRGTGTDSATRLRLNRPTYGHSSSNLLNTSKEDKSGELDPLLTNFVSNKTMDEGALSYKYTIKSGRIMDPRTTRISLQSNNGGLPQRIGEMANSLLPNSVYSPSPAQYIPNASETAFNVYANRMHLGKQQESTINKTGPRKLLISGDSRRIREGP